MEGAETSGQTSKLSARMILSGLLGWMLLLSVSALLLDVRVADVVHREIRVPEMMWLFHIMKAPGHFAFTLLVAAALVVFRHRWQWRAAAYLCLSGIVSGLSCALLKWCVGRTRPFHGVGAFELHPFTHGIAGLFSAENQSFPSGHTCLAFATAAAMSLLVPRWSAAFYAVALVVASERVLQGSHYVGDVVAASGLGILSAMMTWLWMGTWVAFGRRRVADASALSSNNGGLR